MRVYARYGQPPPEHPPAFFTTMQRIWDLGSLPDGRADTELRRPYHLITKGKAPLTKDDMMALGQMTDAQLCHILPWLGHRLSLMEASAHVARGETAPAVTAEDNL